LIDRARACDTGPRDARKHLAEPSLQLDERQSPWEGIDFLEAEPGVGIRDKENIDGGKKQTSL
jgi:hypothetical protein